MDRQRPARRVRKSRKGWINNDPSIDGKCELEVGHSAGEEEEVLLRRDQGQLVCFGAGEWAG
ncbi:hypothetical protein J5Y04_37215 [Kitasatospora sp. RG8]|uniref:hypothetical protein n=1 Tax=Kitasatospora sp. RG8 TaxID=2820815 RepID=UPI001ADF5EEB|nr:hypothetical protein [Kitasatospora sp. RG8]MBP0455117.1 hypothetical protein [Kitasatospora sp. RG8]